MSDPIVYEILKNLESSKGSQISKAEVKKAIKEVANSNQTKVDVEKLNALVETIFETVESSINELISRSDLR